MVFEPWIEQEIEVGVVEGLRFDFELWDEGTCS